MPVEVHWFIVTEMLIGADLLTERDIDNRRKVGQALSLWIAQRHA